MNWFDYRRYKFSQIRVPTLSQFADAKDDNEARVRVEAILIYV